MLAVAVAVGALATPQAGAQAEPWTIAADGLGPLRVGASIDSIRTELPASYELGPLAPLAPDLQGHVVSVDGVVHALLPTTADGVVTTVIVIRGGYETSRGVGPGSLVGDAEDIYGDASFSWDPDDQGRERVVFDNGPAGLSFRTSEAVGPQAGVYGNTMTTVLYDQASRLSSVWIIGGAPSSTADPGAEEDRDAADPATEGTAADDGVTDDSGDQAGAEAADADSTVPLAKTGNDVSLPAAAGLTACFLGAALVRRSSPRRR